jgi:peptidoglycan hydrolase-like protein with peptidoglycan-binding domain
MVLKRGSKGPEVLKLQNGLASLGYDVGKPDGDFGGKTEDAVEDFQEAADLTPDGIFGKGSMAAYNARVAAEFQFVVTVPPDPVDLPADKKNKWVAVRCHVVGKGFSSTTLRDDAAASFKGLVAAVEALGGKLSSAGGRRPLSQGGGKAQSKTSMHYLGRAHDMALGSGMQNPLRDAAICVRESPANRKWVVWLRTTNTAVPEVTLQAVQCSTVNGKTILKTITVTDRFFNFTELAAQHGWTGISARKFFFKGGSFAGAEFWHFQWEQGLVRGKTTFGSELLRLYSPAECRKLKWWDEVKDAVFGEDFN